MRDIAWVGSLGYDDTTAITGQTYGFWVRARHGSGSSVYGSFDTAYRATHALRTPIPHMSGVWPDRLIRAFTGQVDPGEAGADHRYLHQRFDLGLDFGAGTRSTGRNPAPAYAVGGTCTAVL